MCRFTLRRMFVPSRAMSLLLGAIGSVGFARLAAAAGPPVYDVTYIGEGSIAAINEPGAVVGTTTGAQRAWVADPDYMLLPLPDGMISSVANDINDLGEIVGAVGPYSTVEFFGHAALWTPDGNGGYTVQILEGLSNDVTCFATALNNLGDIVGYSSNGTYRMPVLFQQSGPPVDLSSTGLFDPSDVNDRRFVVDHSFTAKRLDLNTMTVEDLGVPNNGSYLATTAAAINENNQVAGLAILTCCSNCDRQVARYTDGVGWEIFSQCGQYNGAGDINDSGDLVMQLNLTAAVRYEGIGTFDIESLIDAPVGHWYVSRFGGQAINNGRQIACFAQNQELNQAGVVLLTPREPGPVLSVSDLVRGQQATFTVAGANGSDPVYFLYSLKGTGTGPCVQFFGGLCLDLLKPVELIGSAIADGSGQAVLNARVPGNAPLIDVSMQAVARRGSNGSGSVKSNTVTKPILP